MARDIQAEMALAEKLGLSAAYHRMLAFGVSEIDTLRALIRFQTAEVTADQLAKLYAMADFRWRHIDSLTDEIRQAELATAAYQIQALRLGLPVFNR